MAGQQQGYRIVPHNTYDQYRSYCLANGINCDYMFGNQCMDTIMNLYYQYGQSLKAGPNGYAYEVWTNRRWQNNVFPFQMFDEPRSIKRGDILVFNHHGAYYTGHIALADEDYRGGSTIRILGQNQGQGIGWGCASNVINYSIGLFIGGFHNKEWSTTPDPEPTGGSKERKFPWAVFTRKIRKR